MPCRKVATYNGKYGAGKLDGGGGYATEAECNQACKEGACCEGTTCSVKPACQCQGTGKTFKGIGTVCSPNPCVNCHGCVAPHPTYMNVTFSQTAPISGGYHQSLIDLSGSYSVPSSGFGNGNADIGCNFCGRFSKTYANAVVTSSGTFSLVVNYFIIASIWRDSKSIGIAMYGAQMNAGDVQDRGPGIYQFSVSTGGLYAMISPSCEFANAEQLQSFDSCEGNTYQAVRAGWTAASPTNNSQYRITLNQDAVVCGSFSWAKA